MDFYFLFGNSSFAFCFSSKSVTRKEENAENIYFTRCLARPLHTHIILEIQIETTSARCMLRKRDKSLR